jgi:hypothetical protein
MCNLVLINALLHKSQSLVRQHTSPWQHTGPEFHHKDRGKRAFEAEKGSINYAHKGQKARQADASSAGQFTEHF